MIVRRRFGATFLLLVAAGCLVPTGPAVAQLRLQDICHVKGQEENALQGLGVVVGLKGTGDNKFQPTARALATMMKLMGSPIAKGPNNQDLLTELKDARNVAMVFVTATVPAAGARQGDKLDCRVSAVNAKSLEGGYLMLTPLLGPRPGNQRVYGFAQGPLQLESADYAASAAIHQGCRLEEDFLNVFSDTEHGKLTLVLDKDHAGFQTAQEIADLLNSQSFFQTDRGDGSYIAKAVDQVNIDVAIPAPYRDDPVLFVSQVMSQRILNPQPESRVVVNERAGTIVIGAEVEIGAVAISHKNLAIETGASRFIPVDPSGTGGAKLKNLIDALDALQVPTVDMIEIIKRIQRSGKLYGRLIIE